MIHLYHFTLHFSLISSDKYVCIWEGKQGVFEMEMRTMAVYIHNTMHMVLRVKATTYILLFQILKYSLYAFGPDFSLEYLDAGAFPQYPFLNMKYVLGMFVSVDSSTPTISPV